MKFSVGYQLTNTDLFIDTVKACRDSICEIYFSVAGMPNGRGDSWNKGFSQTEAAVRQDAELRELADCGFSMNLLFNAMCYGENTLSRVFFNSLGDTLDFCISAYNVNSVTTTSPIIAKFVKNNFDGISVRASVNMEIGTTLGMEYLFEHFDGFYLKREYNRDLSRIEELSQWCRTNGKQLYMLANSGCLNNCSAHVFHDNLVAHENGIARMDNAFTFDGVCRSFLSKEENKKRFFDCTNFVRPEDIHLYEKYFSCIKLATRVSDIPEKIIRAYSTGKWAGSLPSLLEPNHSSLFGPTDFLGCETQGTVCGGKLIYSEARS